MSSALHRDESQRSGHLLQRTSGSPLSLDRHLLAQLRRQNVNHPSHHHGGIHSLLFALEILS
jgi:hypothetical protein